MIKLVALAFILAVIALPAAAEQSGPPEGAAASCQAYQGEARENCELRNEAIAYCQPEKEHKRFASCVQSAMKDRPMHRKPAASGVQQNPHKKN